MKVGLISDTHGLLRPQAARALQGCAHIIHAGDIGGREILDALARIAPVTAVRGNNDFAPWAQGVRDAERLVLEDKTILVVHDLTQLRLEEPVHAVIAGHSHKPGARTENGVLYVNPGSAGPRRFRLPVSVGFLHVSAAGITPELLELEV